ncbi:MAG: transposase zinc-binding domain-containing protein [Candidatus Riflebacteria bacterium]|nr:transposase zinc-binding domain-containing protein [Candidatus Riflebacteria bacterium]
MMKLSELLQQYKQAFEKTYGHRLLPSQRQAISAILACRTPDAGEMTVQCPDCGTTMAIRGFRRRGYFNSRSPPT